MSPYLLLLALVVLSHAPLLTAGYVQDDHLAVERTSAGSAGGVLERSYWEGIKGDDRTLYRPVTVASYALERAAAGGAKAPLSHAINIALHAAVCALVYSIAIACGAGAPAALLGALLFALTPSKSEAVANVVGRAELLAAAFSLGAVRLALLPASRAAAWGIGIGVLLAAGAKETGVVAFPLAAWALLARSTRPKPLEAAGTLAPALLAFTVFVVLRTSALEAFFPPQSVPVMDNPLVAEHGARYAATALALVARYAGIVLFPFGLANDYSGASVPMEASFLAWRPVLGLVLLALLLWTASRRRALALAAGIVLLPYLLVGNLFVPVGAILAERFLYLPVAGVSLLAAFLLDAARPVVRKVAWGAVALLAAAMFLRAVDWKDDATIFTATARHNPKSARAAYWLGTIAAERKAPPGAAIAHYDAAIASWPRFASPWVGKALLLARAGDLRSAESALREAARLEPQWPSPQFNLALALHRRGDLAGAERAARKTVLLDPGHAGGWAELGHLRFETGRYAAAAEAYGRAIALGRADLAPRLTEAEARAR